MLIEAKIKLEYSGTIRLIKFYKAVFPGWLNYI